MRMLAPDYYFRRARCLASPFATDTPRLRESPGDIRLLHSKTAPYECIVAITSKWCQWEPYSTASQSERCLWPCNGRSFGLCTTLTSDRLRPVRITSTRFPRCWRPNFFADTARRRVLQNRSIILRLPPHAPKVGMNAENVLTRRVGHSFAVSVQRASLACRAFSDLRHLSGMLLPCSVPGYFPDARSRPGSWLRGLLRITSSIAVVLASPSLRMGVHNSAS